MWQPRETSFLTRCLLAGAMLLFLMSASGCSTTTLPPQLVPILPPEDLMQPTSAPQWTPRTHKELLRWAIEADKALQQCNADKAAMQEYVRTMKARGH